MKGVSKSIKCIKEYHSTSSVLRSKDYLEVSIIPVYQSISVTMTFMVFVAFVI